MRNFWSSVMLTSGRYKGNPIAKHVRLEGMKPRLFELWLALFRSACHTESGAGLSGLFPPLRANPSVQASDPSNVVRLVLQGGKSAASRHAPTGTAMPSFGWKLSDNE